MLLRDTTKSILYSLLNKKNTDLTKYLDRGNFWKRRVVSKGFYVKGVKNYINAIKLNFDQ